MSILIYEAAEKVFGSLSITVIFLMIPVITPVILITEIYFFITVIPLEIS